MKHRPEFIALVESVKSDVTEITIEQYQAEDKWQLIDVREDNEWLKDHLPDAKHLGRGVIERDIESRFPDKNSAILLYCGGGHRSVLAAFNLQKMGYTDVASMAGGYSAWVQHQLPVVQE